MNKILLLISARYRSAETNFLFNILFGLFVLLLVSLIFYLIFHYNVDPLLCDGFIGEGEGYDSRMPGVRCPNCLKRGIEKWVLPGKHCPICSTAC